MVRLRVDNLKSNPGWGGRQKRQQSPLTAKQLAQMRGQVEAIAARRRAATHCRKGHKYTSKTLGRNTNGRRQCVTCRQDAAHYSMQARLRELLRFPDSPRHGHLGYKDGCRCPKCYAGETIYLDNRKKEYKEKKLAATS